VVVPGREHRAAVRCGEAADSYHSATAAALVVSGPGRLILIAVVVQAAALVAS
jgi:hypothetical protein